MHAKQRLIEGMKSNRQVSRKYSKISGNLTTDVKQLRAIIQIEASYSQLLPPQTRKAHREHGGNSLGDSLLVRHCGDLGLVFTELAQAEQQPLEEHRARGGCE
eukprot:scaffold276553_cov16-Prasinocladus_malaysianus.AAC.1